MTGLGPVSGPMVDGQPAAVKDAPQATTQTATATIGNVAANVIFTGLTPGFIGLYQMNVTVPASAPSGSGTYLNMSIGGAASPPFRLPKQ
jgi:uncharacterized protein (TIGR03437 family)